MRKTKIGVMDFHGSVDITDPCYDKDVWCRMNNVKLSEGEYACYVWRKPDYSDEEWGRFCDRVRNGDAWLTEDGFYSSSGYGDGCYGVYAYKQDGAITALELRFL